MKLFDLFEGSIANIDELQSRRIEDLEAKMDDFMARAKESDNPKYKEAMRHAYAKAKAERDSYYKLNVEEEIDTNYTYTVFIDGTKEGTYGSKEEAKAVVKRKKEQAPGREYTIRPKSRTSMSSIKKFQRNRDRNIDEDDLITAEGYATTIGPDTPPLDPAKQWKIKVRQLIADYIKNPQGLYNIAKRKGPNSPEAFAYDHIMHPSGKIKLPPNAVTFEGFTDDEYAGTYSPEAIKIGRYLIKTFNLANELDQQLAIEIVDNVIASGETDLAVIKKQVIKYLRKSGTVVQLRKEQGVAEAISKKDLLGRLQKDLPKVNDPKNKHAKPVEWTGAGKDDYGYTGYQGHGMPTDKQERESARKKKGVTEGNFVVATQPESPEEKEKRDTDAQTIRSGIARDRARAHKRDILQSYAKLGRIRTEAIWALEHDVYMNKDQILDYIEQQAQDPSLSALEYMHDLGHDIDGLFKNVTRFLTGAGISPDKIQTVQNKITQRMGDINEQKLAEKIDVVTDPSQTRSITRNTQGITTGAVYQGNKKPATNEVQSKVDSKSWMTQTRAKYPNAKFMQAKMPGAPIRAYINGKVVAEFNFDSNPDIEEASMNWAAHKSTGPKFSGYLKGTDPAPTEFGNKSVGGMEEGIDGNMTVRSNPLSQPLRKRNYVAKNAQSSGAGKHNNNLKAATARGQVKHKGKAFELDEMTDDEVAKIRKDAEAYTTKQMTAPKKVEPKKSFMQQVGDKQIGMAKGAWKGLTGQLEESDNFITWAVRNGYNFTKDPAVYESARTKYKALVESKGLGKRVRVVSGPAAGQIGTIGEIRNGKFKDAPKYYTIDLDNGSHVQVRKEALRLINDVDEGWKSKLAGAALAGAAALGASGAHARVMPGDDPNINRLTGAPITQTQAGASDVKPSAPASGFSKAYLQKVANGEHPRPMLSKEKAQELLSQMTSDNVNESLKRGEYYIWTVYFDDGSQKRIKVTSDEFDPYAYYAKKNQVVVNVDYDWSIEPQQ